uniref:Uncharacterized protein n=1 Tax=uncultured bacterium ws172H5 TaxID=1131829 RepID=I1X4W4_9BACT|nr:hypothetical protein ws172H5_0033 [uncultured bacterium ws172H5]
MSVSIKECALPALRQTVQHNCHIADALYAGDYTLCIYLLKMREFYRWESGLPYNSTLENSSVGEWLREREQLWDSLESNQFESVKIDDTEFDPFDTRGINSALKPYKLVYSGGLGLKTKPHFFLGKLHNRQDVDDYTVYISSNEYARDLTAPPAMALGQTIFIRRESLKRMLWEKLEEWRWNRPANAMARAIEHYEFNADVDTALDAMTENELNSVLLHEIGEVEAGKWLGEEWEQLLAALPRSKAEIMLRALRDHLADALSTLPALLEQEQTASLHFYFANLNSMRKHMYPSLLSAYQQWHENGKLKPLSRQVQQGRDHWQSQAENVLELYRQRGPEAREAIESLLENSLL